MVLKWSNYDSLQKIVFTLLNTYFTIRMKHYIAPLNKTITKQIRLSRSITVFALFVFSQFFFRTHFYHYSILTSLHIHKRRIFYTVPVASVGQADVQRFELHFGHNWLSCGLFLVKTRHFRLTLAQTKMAKLAISLSGWLGRYANVEYLQSLYLKRRGQLRFQV